MEKGLYQHYKGGHYLVLGFGTLEETLEPAVIYQHLADDYSIWIRKQTIFEEIISVPEISYTGPRFLFLRAWSVTDAAEHPQAKTLL